MSNSRQRTRKAVRDKKKRWDLLVSSIRVTMSVSESLSSEMIMAFVEVAHELQLPVASLIGLEALRVRDKQATIDKLARSNEALEKQIVYARMELRKAQETISNLNVRHLRRSSKKAKAQHPEKRHGR